MDIESKYKIVEKIIQSNDEILLNEIKLLIGLSEVDFYHDLPEKVKQAINNAKSELDRGEGIAHETVKNMLAQYFSDRLQKNIQSAIQQNHISEADLENWMNE